MSGSVTREHFEQFVRERGGYRIRLHLRATEDGGRRTPLLGTVEYRVNWSIGTRDPHDQRGGPTLIDAETLPPGTEGTATLTPLIPDPEWEAVGVGTDLTAFEGDREVAQAVVTDVIPPRESSD